MIKSNVSATRYTGYQIVSNSTPRSRMGLYAVARHTGLNRKEFLSDLYFKT
jgi:hypothetical protein